MHTLTQNHYSAPQPPDSTATHGVSVVLYGEPYAEQVLSHTRGMDYVAHWFLSFLSFHETLPALLYKHFYPSAVQTAKFECASDASRTCGFVPESTQLKNNAPSARIHVLCWITFLEIFFGPKVGWAGETSPKNQRNPQLFHAICSSKEHDPTG